MATQALCLTTGTVGADAHNNNGAISYTYDAVGNRKTLTSTLPPAGGVTYTYDADDRLGSDSYDADGNTVNSLGTANTYDFENHMVQHGFVTIVYDGDGNRVSEAAGGVNTNYLVDMQNPTGYAQVVDELQGGTVARTYSYGLERISETQTLNSALATSFYGYDGHGSVRQLTNAAGTVTDTYDYDAFGNLVNQTGSTPNNYLFAGEQYDPALSLYYNRSRYLNTNTGRFWTMDPFAGDPQQPASLHRYLYAYTNPVNRTDPTGNLTILDRMLAGQAVHTYIGNDFEARTGGISNNAIATIVSYLFEEDSNAVYLRPDLVDPSTRQVYEIKTVKGAAAGVLQLANYIKELNAATPPDALGPWKPGITYQAPEEVPIYYLNLDASVNPTNAGIISYELIDNGHGGITGLVEVALAVSLAALGLSLGVSALTAQFGY